MNITDWWIKEAIKFPVDHLILAINYFKMRFGNGIKIGKKTAKEILTSECLGKMLDAGYLTQKDDGYYFLAG
jgi:hypothetical protein